MKHKISSLVATLKNVDTFGLKYATDFPESSLGGQQFAIVHAAVVNTASLGAAQVSGALQTHSAVLSKAAGRFHLQGELKSIARAAHSLALLDVAGLAGKFLLPHKSGDQTLLNAARAFAANAAEFQDQFVSIGLAPDFIANLNADITAFEATVTDKHSGLGTQVGATGALEDTAHQATIALNVLNTIVRNTYHNDPAKLAEWATASHVVKRTHTANTTSTPIASA